MQKISSYLYSNRIQLIADLAALETDYPVEWKIVYQRPVKIYKGVDNVIELDVKNADQKRINILGKTIKFVVMDQTDKEVNTYDAIPMDDGSTLGAHKGIATLTIPKNDLSNLDPQYLKYSVYQINADTTQTLLYGNTQFGGHGTIQLLESIIPKTRPVQRYDDFQQQTNYNGATMQDWVITYHSSAIPTKFYEAEPTTSIDVSVSVTDFIGTITIEGTKNPTIGHEVFLNGDITSQTFSTARNTPVLFDNIDTTDYTYIRVKYIKTAGTVDSFTVTS